MAKKKKRTKEANPGSPTESGPDSSSEEDAVDGATSEAPAKPSAPVDFDAATRDKFASSFRPAWQVAEESAASAKPAQEPLRQEHALSGEISLDSIPLPPLPTSKPKRQVIGVLLVILVIVVAGIVVSQRSQPAESAPPAQSSER